jgi:hypothetical protein
VGVSSSSAATGGVPASSGAAETVLQEAAAAVTSVPEHVPVEVEEAEAKPYQVGVRISSQNKLPGFRGLRHNQRQTCISM